ncbi:hypothetical protein MAE02_63070 [Microvirga aerophila]|uniref:Amidohydrolase-related domain-containing protein n=2 Tax=Microvirga aerophila TaxID=670291 RepID=A0A512C343_9HYPH|nr:hypothetical protein MAE02_63070 [Microvirga aerophila]
MLKSARARPMIEAIPPDALLVESDAPFRGGKGDLKGTLLNLSDLTGRAIDEVEATTDDNARRILPEPIAI